MRYARFAIFLSALMIATGVFLPYIQLGIGGIAFGKGSSMTLYGSVSNYRFLEAASARADVSLAERITDGLLAQAGEKAKPLTRKLREAKSTLRDIREVRNEEYVETLGTVLRITGIGFLGILLIVGWLLMKSLSTGLAHRRRAIVIAVMMVLVSAISVALFIVSGEALRLGNAEIGAPLLGLGSGAYTMLVGGACGALASLVALWFEVKATRKPAVQA